MLRPPTLPLVICQYLPMTFLTKAVRSVSDVNAHVTGVVRESRSRPDGVRGVPTKVTAPHQKPSMERNFSVDDVVGEIWRFGAAGLGRSESDAAVQQLLKQVPSASNLQNLQPVVGADAVGGNGGDVVGGGGGNGGAGGPASMALPAAGDVGGVPRVASLDFLRQFMVPQQTSLASGMAAGDVTGGIVASGAADVSGTWSRSLVQCGGGRVALVLRYDAHAFREASL